MARKALVLSYGLLGTGPDISIQVGYTNSAGTLIDDPEGLNIAVTGLSTDQDYANAVETAILAWSVSQGFGLTSSDIVWLIPKTLPRATSALSLSIQTGTGATGTQVSTSRDSEVLVGGTIVTAATLLSGAVGTLVLEVAPTNSATAGDWVEYGRITNGQVFSLAVAIGCTQTIAGQMNAFVPAGYYVKVRSISTTGTPTFSINSSRKVLL